MGDLVSVITDDGIKLHGMWLGDPIRQTESSWPVDAVLTVHGVGSNFYSGRMFPYLGRRFHDAGVPVLCANNRGRDSVYGTLSGQRQVRLGAAYEIVADCCRDLSAWCHYLNANGFSRIALLGHSLGAIKAIFAQSQQALPGVARLVAISSPRLTFEILSGGSQGELFQRDFEFANDCVDRGQPEQLFETRVPVPLLMSARTFVDKYGPADRYDILSHLPSIAVDTLVVYGEKELGTFNGAFHGLPEAIDSLGRGSPLSVTTIAGADHFYSDRLPQLTEAVAQWLQPSDEGPEGEVERTMIEADDD